MSRRHDTTQHKTVSFRIPKWFGGPLLLLALASFAGGIGGFFHAPFATTSGMKVAFFATALELSATAPVVLLGFSLLFAFGHAFFEYMRNKVVQRTVIEQIKIRSLEEHEAFLQIDPFSAPPEPPESSIPDLTERPKITGVDPVSQKVG
jgi:hypothetical protein